MILRRKTDSSSRARSRLKRVDGPWDANWEHSKQLGALESGHDTRPRAAQKVRGIRRGRATSLQGILPGGAGGIRPPPLAGATLHRTPLAPGRSAREAVFAAPIRRLTFQPGSDT